MTEPAHDPSERLLGEILGQGAIARQEKRQSERVWTMPYVQLSEPRRLSTLQVPRHDVHLGHSD